VADESSGFGGFAPTTRSRVFVVCLVVLLALPTVVAGGFHGPIPMSTADDQGTGPSLAEHPNLTVVTAQGGEVGDGSDSRVVVFDGPPAVQAPLRFVLYSGPWVSAYLLR
jgi:hypothetical protein